MLKQIIGTRDKGVLIPQSLVESLTKDMKFFAMMTAVDNGLLTQRIDKPFSVQEFMEWQQSEEIKDLQFGFIFSKGETLTAESLQPFVGVKNASDVPVCTVLLGGTFMTAVPDKSPHAPSYHAFQKIQLKLSRLYNNASSFDAFRKALEGEEFVDDMDMILGKEGAMSILHSDGVITNLGKAIKGGNFSWGIISDALGYKEKEQKAAEPEKPKTGLLAGLGKIGQAVSGKKEEPKQEVIPPMQATAAVQPKADTAAVKAGIEFVMWKPKPNIPKEKQLNRACNDKFGCTPVDAWRTYQSGGAFPAPLNGMKFKNTDHYESFRRAAAQSSDNTVPQEAITNIPVTPPKEEAPKAPAPDVTDISHVVGAQGKKHFSETFMKRPSIMTAVAESREDVLNPKVLAKRDNKASTTFAEQSGLKQGVLDLLGMSEQDVQEFLKNEDPKLVFLFVRDLLLETITARADKKGESSKSTQKGGLLAGLMKTG